MKELHLLGKKVFLDRSPLLMQYQVGPDWLEHWVPKSGTWECDGEWLIGYERKSWYAMLLSRRCFEGNVMLSFTVKADLPATRDLNAVICAEWDEEASELGESYVCGVNGWYEHKSGIERNRSSNLYSTT